MNIISGENIKAIFLILKSEIPLSDINFGYNDEYTLLIAVVLSAQATDKQVDKITSKLFQLADTPQKMVELGLERLTQEMRSITLFNNKAKHIIGLSKMLIEKFNSKVPKTRNELMTLPGVGRKTADIMMNVVHKKPTIAVDTHVARLAQRLNMANTSNRDKIANILEVLLPQYLDHNTVLIAHTLMVTHGRYICTSRKPKCDICPIKEYCAFYKEAFNNKSIK